MLLMERKQKGERNRREEERRGKSVMLASESGYKARYMKPQDIRFWG